MGNTHVLPNVAAEVQAQLGDLLSPAILGSTLSAPGSGLTLAAFSTYGYVRNGSPTRLVYVNQPAAPVTLAGGDGAYWLALMHDTHSVVAGWNRTPGTHYSWRASGTQPADPPGGLVLAGVTVTSGNVSAVDLSVNYPNGKVAFGGPTGTLAFDKTFTFNTSIKQLSSQLFLAPDHPGDNRIAFYSTLNTAGGTNRWAFYGAGSAPSAFNGEVTIGGAVRWSSWAAGLQLRLGDLVPPGFVLDVNGDAMVRGHTGLGVAPLPGQFHLNCGSANFTSVNTPSLYATNITATTLTAGGTIHGNLLESDTWVTAAEISASARVLCYRLGIAGGDPGATYALYSAGGSHRFDGLVGINGGPSGAYWLEVNGSAWMASLATPSLTATGLTATTLNTSTIAASSMAYLSGNCQILNLLGVGQAIDGRWNLICGSANIGGAILSGTNITCGQIAVSTGFQPGWYASVYNLFSTTQIHAMGQITTEGRLQALDSYIVGNMGIGTGPVPTIHLTLGGTGANKVGGGPWGDTSNRALKRSIAAIPDALGLLLAQQGRVYEWEEPTRAALLPGLRYGLIAEEVTVPQWTTELPEGGGTVVAAEGFEALAIEALRAIVQRLEVLEGRA